MSTYDIRTALEAHLLALPLPAIPTEFDNHRIATPPIDAPWQSCSLLPAQPDNPGLDEKTTMQRGVFQVLLRYPSADGAGDAQHRADALCGHFKAPCVLTAGTIQVRTRGRPWVGAPIPGSDRFVIPVSIRWYSIF